MIIRCVLSFSFSLILMLSACAFNAESEAYPAAVKAKDLDALLATGNSLYAPCEACCQLYHPGVTAEPW